MQSAEKRPLNVCVVCTYDIAEDGGVKHHAFAVANALRRRGDKVSVVGPSTRALHEPDVYGFGGVMNFQANGSGNAFGILVNPFKLRRFFAEHRFDVIHVHEPLNPAMGYWASWLAPRTPHVATFHAFGERETLSLKLARAAIAPFVRPFYQRGIAVSEPAQTWAAPSWKRPLTIVPNGVSIKQFRPASRPHRDDGPLRLLFVGKLIDPRKGFRYLTEAYARLRARGVAVELDVVGDGGTGDGLPDLPGLAYHGSVPLARLVEMYRDCDVFVAPSTGQESFGLVLLEAMATARPIICSAIEGYKQVADAHGARRVPPRDSLAIEHAILELAGDPLLRWRMGVWNKNRAETFDWDHIAQRVRDEYVTAIDMVRRDARVLPATGTAPILPPAPTLALPEPMPSVVDTAPDEAMVGSRQAGSA
jgi:phosphatidylinositol alpha-mannosyltransferase